MQNLFRAERWGVVISRFATGKWPAELMRYALLAAGGIQGRGKCCDNICIIKKTGVLHNAENIATRAIRAHT